MKRFVGGIVVVVCALFVFDCRDSRLEFVGHPTQQNDLAEISVLCSVSDDAPLGGPGAFAFVLTIENNSSKPLSQCVLILNDKYRARLAQVECYAESGWRTKLFRTATILADSRLELIFSHDTNNHLVFRDDEDRDLPRDAAITSLTLECTEGTNRWELTKKESGK